MIDTIRNYSKQTTKILFLKSFININYRISSFFVFLIISNFNLSYSLKYTFYLSFFIPVHFSLILKFINTLLIYFNSIIELKLKFDVSILN